MTQTEKLQALLNEAVKKGYKLPFGQMCTVETTVSDLEIWVRFYDDNYVKSVNYQRILFNHDFARALFGDGFASFKFQQVDRKEPNYIFLKEWQGRLQQAVISDNPIDYMYQQLEGAG